MKARITRVRIDFLNAWQVVAHIDFADGSIYGSCVMEINQLPKLRDVLNVIENEDLIGKKVMVFYRPEDGVVVALANPVTKKAIVVRERDEQ